MGGQDYIAEGDPLRSLRETIHKLIKIASSRVEKTAYDELPGSNIAVSGAVAGALATLTLLAVAHLADVVVLRHFYAFLIGYIATVFSSVSLVMIHTIIGAIAAYVHFRAEELMNSGQWLAFACFLPLFASTGVFIGDRLVQVVLAAESAFTPLLKTALSVLATLAMTWLFWVPWMAFYRIWLNRYVQQRRASQHRPETDASMTRENSDSMESSRSYMRVRRQIALIRKHRRDGIPQDEAARFDLFKDVSGELSDLPEGRQVTHAVRQSPLRRIGFISAAVLAGIVIFGSLYGRFVPGGLRGVFGIQGNATDGPVIRVLVKSADVSTGYIYDLANQALGQVQQDARVDVANINRFSMFAVRAMVASGESGIIVGTREELRDMATHGLLVDLTPMIERDQVDLTVFVDCCIEELTYNGDVFALPLSTSPLLLYINTKALSHTDVSPHVPPVLWSDLMAYAKSLTWFRKSGGVQVVSQLGFTVSDGLWRAWLQMASDVTRHKADGRIASALHMDGLLPNAFEQAGGSDPDVLSLIPDEWKLLVDVASGLGATTFPDDLGRYRNPFYERQHDPAFLFANGDVAMVVSDYRLHRALRDSSLDLEYAVADLPAPDWAMSGTSISNGLGIGMLLSRPDTSPEVQNMIETSWEVIKTLATDESMQASIASHSGLLPGLKSLYPDWSAGLPKARALLTDRDEIDLKFHAAQLSASPATAAHLSSTSLARIYSLLDRLAKGAEPISYVLEQVAATLAVQ